MHFSGAILSAFCNTLLHLHPDETGETKSKVSQGHKFQTQLEPSLRLLLLCCFTFYSVIRSFHLMTMCH